MDLSQVYHTFWYLAQSVSIVWENRHLAWRDIPAGLRLQPGKERIEVAHLAVHRVRAAIPYLQVFLQGLDEPHPTAPWGGVCKQSISCEAIQGC